MSRFRKWLSRQDKGATKRLAEAAEVSHAQISRIADKHRGASLRVALALSKATGLPPSEFQKVTTPSGKKPAQSAARQRA